MSDRVLGLFSLSLLAAALPAVDGPRIDLLGGARFTDTYISLGLGAVDAKERSSGQTLDAYQLGVAGFSVSGYSSREDGRAGGLLGVGALARTWLAKDQGVTLTAAAPFVVMVGGGYYDPSERMRLTLTGELGPGLGFSRASGGGASETRLFRPAVHAGLHAGIIGRVQDNADLGLTIGYEYDRLDRVTFSGAVIALVMRWRPAPAE